MCLKWIDHGIPANATILLAHHTTAEVAAQILASYVNNGNVTFSNVLLILSGHKHIYEVNS